VITGSGISILTDILIASPSEAEAILADPGHHERWPCLQERDLDPLVIADLLAALGADEDAATESVGRPSIGL